MARKGNRKASPVTKLFKFLIAGILLVFLVFFLFNGVRHFLLTAGLFKVREVVRSPSLSSIRSRDLEKYLGKNLFAIELKKMDRRLRAQYPHIEQLHIVREFPDRLCLMARTRDPFAWTSLSGKTVLLDKEGAVLPAQGSPSRMPEIRGVEDVRKFVWGQSFHSERVRIALDIIQAIRNNKYLDPYEVKTVDIQQLSRIEIYLENGAPRFMTQPMTVLMDRDRITQKVQALGILLSQGNLNPNEIKYIDLRFKEPILAKQ